MIRELEPNKFVLDYGTDGEYVLSLTGLVALRNEADKILREKGLM